MIAAIDIVRIAALRFIANNALSRGAAISFFAVTSLAPILLIVVAIAGFVFGADAARKSLVDELATTMGAQSAAAIQSIIASASDPTAGTAATLLGVIMMIITASGVFGEMQAALNVTWHAAPPKRPFLSLVRARASSLGLVAALGFLLIISLTVSALLSALSRQIDLERLMQPAILSCLNTLVSITLFSLLFGAIFKVLPDCDVAWRDVITGALVTAIMFTAGKSAIGWYLGTTAASSAYGAASAVIITLLWTYYSSLIFLFGAEVTKAISDRRDQEQQQIARTSGAVRQQ